ncbi:MAG: hypothetical protein WCW13_03495 [archaeon]|jgi:hypothetical protein
MDWTGERLDKFGELLEQGKSLQDVADYFGTSYDNIRQVKSTYKIGKNLITKPKVTVKLLEKSDLASRIRVLRGEEVRVDEAHFGFTDEQLQSWFSGVSGFVQFCLDVLKVELQDYQVRMAEMMIEHKRCCFVLGRQSGKDFVISCFVLWSSVVHSNQRILLVSAAQRQSDLLFSRIMNFIASNNELFDSVSKSNLEVIEFTNGSDLYSLPATGQIRGYTEVTHVFLNEVAHGITPEDLQAVEPMLAIKHGSLIMTSSPAGCSGVLWDAFNNPMYAKLRLPSTVNKYISSEWIEEQKKAMPSIAFETEILANFSESIDSFFKFGTINSVTKDYSLRQTCPKEEGKTYYAGIDWGRIQDSSVVTVVSKDKENNLLVEAIFEMFNIDFKSQEERIKLLHADWKFKKICAEHAGLSINSCENLKRDGLPIDYFKPTLDSKSEAYSYLLKQMEDKKITIPKHDKLQYELRVFKFELTTQGKMKLHHIQGGSDDFVDSLCYATWATKGSGFFVGFFEWPAPSYADNSIYNYNPAGYLY